ncbi:MAG: NADH-quinone oxidoreductase subunit C [Coriobacteriia bacterium]
MPPDATALKSTLTAAGVPCEIEESGLGLVARVASGDAAFALAALRERDFPMLVDLLGTDTGEGIEITYHVRSLSRDEDVFIKSDAPYSGELCSVWNVYASALLPERETAELFGLALGCHPNPKRLLTTEGVDPLLLKSVPIRTAQEVRNR